MLGSLAEHGLEAFVTLHHMTSPRWFAERGGWLAPDAVERFERYCERAGQALGDLMPWACTINEPQISAFNGYLTGEFPPGIADARLWKQVTRTLIAAHAAAVRALGAPKTGIPAGIGRAIRLAATSGLPVVITENGLATPDDRERVGFMRDHLAEVAACLRDGIDIRGYMCWSAFDSFEWNHGFRQRFGLVGIDRDDDLRRVPRPSAHAYRALARTRSLSMFEEAGSG